MRPHIVRDPASGAVPNAGRSKPSLV